MSIVKKCHGAILTLFGIVMIVMPELKQFKLDCLLTEVERIFQRGCCPFSLSFKSLSGNTAKLMSVSIADLELPTEGKFFKTDSVLGNSNLIIC